MNEIFTCVGTVGAMKIVARGCSFGPVRRADPVREEGHMISISLGVGVTSIVTDVLRPAVAADGAVPPAGDAVRLTHVSDAPVQRDADTGEKVHDSAHSDAPPEQDAGEAEVITVITSQAPDGDEPVLNHGSKEPTRPVLTNWSKEPAP